MIPSELNKQIVIEKESTTTNRVGTPKEAYVFVKECFAQITTLSGTSQYDVVGTSPFTVSTFVIRYDERVDYKCRIIYNNNYYKIEHLDLVGRKHWMKLSCIDWDRATSY